ncbi:hypothetical protein CDD83_1523 [Cordyceps sp. RAO-2017]|nr:hypothetical protein CDD83_1523 [Cordyceps sp. RAO-2017]
MASSPRGPAASSRLASPKAPRPPSPFERLPDEIIEQILLATDPNGFASLVLVNSKWRAASQRPHLYRAHLADCPSWPATRPAPAAPGPRPDDLPSGPDPDDLPRLRRLFAREAKRNLSHAYLRPRQTIVKLVSKSNSSSSCPGGEGMQFAPSLRGHHLLAYNSSRIHLIDLRGRRLHVKRELKIHRRPVSACVTDDAALLAVLSTDVQVDLYDLRATPPKRRQSLVLNNSPRTIALSSCGSVLAAAYDSGIEVSSLHPGALATDRRAVKCDAVDALAFSLDGTQILGTTTCSPSPSTVVLTAPYYDPGSQPADSNLCAMWTTSILFPNTSRDCSHAILLPRDGHHGEAEWTFTYDRSLETFRAVRLDDLRNGTTHFTGPVPEPGSQSKLLPCTLPAATLGGELVAAAFCGSEVWVYGVPADLDAVPENGACHDNPPPDPARHNGPQGSLFRHAPSKAQDGDNERVPQWQLLCDKLRNNLVAGSKVADLAGVTSVKWVADFAGTSSRERLVVTARGVSGPRLATDEEGIDFMDGGRIALLDFDYGLVDGETSETTIEVGSDAAEVLEEEQRDLATEVALVRRRTVVQRQGGRAARRSAQAAPVIESSPAEDGLHDDPLLPKVVLLRGGGPAGPPAAAAAAADTADGGEGASMEELEAMDAPYAHASPRSGNTLRRAATAVAVNRRLNPRTADGRPIEYRRADGRPEHPHESDADNWVPPPPPYQKEDPGDLPAFLRGLPVAPPPVPPVPSLPSSQQARRHIPTSNPHTARAASPEQRRCSHPRIGGDPLSFGRLWADEIPRPRSSPSLHSVQLGPDDLYDASPPVSPRLSACLFESYRPPSRQGGEPSQSWASSSATAPQVDVRGAPPSVSTEAEAPTDTDHHGLIVGVPPPLPSDTPPDVPVPHFLPTHAAEPPYRRLSNAQTWPLSPPPGARACAQDQARRPSASLSTARQASPPDGGAGGWTPPAERERQRSLQDWMPQMPDFDRPLIISTPTGVSGAFDPPGRQPSTRQSETPILAPIPRHNHVLQARSMLDGAQTTTSAASSPPPPKKRSRPKALPAWLRPASSKAAAAPGVNRRPSRAERSAAKNMSDARRNGWTGKKRGGGRRKGRKAAGGDEQAEEEEEEARRAAREAASSSAGWTEVSGATASKERKCVVM